MVSIFNKVLLILIILFVFWFTVISISLKTRGLTRDYSLIFIDIHLYQLLSDKHFLVLTLWRTIVRDKYFSKDLDFTLKDSVHVFCNKSLHIFNFFESIDFMRMEHVSMLH